MKKKAVEKVEMKESLLKGEALALKDAELEGAAGGAGVTLEELSRLRTNRTGLDSVLPGCPIVDENSQPAQPAQPITKEQEEMMREAMEAQWVKNAHEQLEYRNQYYDPSDSPVLKYLGDRKSVV